MEVLTLIPNRYGFAPGQRGSIELWERVLKPAGINLHWAPFETERLREILYQPGHTFEKAREMLRGYVERLRLLDRLKDYDAVFVYREAALLGPAFLEKRIARRGLPIIYQLDDPLYVPYRSPSNGLFSYLKFFGKIAEICRISKVVIVNSTHHREFVSQYNQNIWQVPSIVDTNQYVYQPQDPNSGRVCIGWSGSPTTVGNLRVVADALRRLRDRVEHDVYLIGGTQFDLPGVEYTAQKWRGETEVEDLRRMQVGMVPLPVNEWNKRKFYMKTAQYMALGIPPVCTPMGSNPEVIEHGVTGFLADTTGEWITYLECMIRDTPLRLEMSERAAREAREKYSLEANTEKVIDAFRSALK
ncbi:MAG TPA: glycosyltransferase family 4 protein [Pyrinomonadaceae bacterium]|jgi:glycosyltransferase involved in cell wall biosynthesis|nr:glycosyltransferase family 4 protein [Pyrinomonadaceae bacterium]